MDDDAVRLRSVSASPSHEKCASKCVRGIVLSAFIYFLTRTDLESEISNLRSHFACVAEQQRHLTVNQADLVVLRGCESYHMHQEVFWGVG